MRKFLSPFLLLAVSIPGFARFPHRIVSLRPVAYWRMTVANETSVIGLHTSVWRNGPTVTAPGGGIPLADDPANRAVVLNAASRQGITTSLPDTLGSAGTLAGWINLTAIPTGTVYLFGKSASGNDLDVQIEGDGKLHFFTGAGNNLAVAPPGGFVAGQWYFIAVTFDNAGAGAKAIYINGTRAIGSTGGTGRAASTSPFTIGESSVWSGRNFDGRIDEVAVWTRALTAEEIGLIYESRNDPGGTITSCLYGITAIDMFTAAGGRGTVEVMTDAGCSWQVTSDSSWLTFTSGTPGTGPGAAVYTVAPNPGAAARRAQFLVSITAPSTGEAMGSYIEQPGTSANSDYPGTVAGLSPMAYWRLNTANETSLIGRYTSAWQNGLSVTPDGGGAPLAAEPANRGASFNSASRHWITTNFADPLATAGTLAGWIKLATLPTGTVYLFGKSAGGNDLDVQIESDQKLHFFTGGGNQINVAPPGGFLAGQWYFVAVTFDNAGSGSKAIYFNGLSALERTGATGRTGSSSPFTIGDSSVFSGRFFNGVIDEVAIWNRALTATEIAAIYQARTAGPPATPCTFTLSSTDTFTAAGGTGSVRVATAAGCAWQAASNANWLTITAGASGNGPGTMTITVAANTANAARTATLTVTGGSPAESGSISFTQPGTTPASDYPGAVTGLAPLAYWRLNAVNEPSVIGGYTSSWRNGLGVTPDGGGAPLAGDPANRGASLNSASRHWISTSFTETLPSAGTLAGWINLATVPSGIFYLFGKSASGNDLDVQIEGDRKLHFFTGGGNQIDATPPGGFVTGQWYFVAVTFDNGGAGYKAIYLNGALAVERTGSPGRAPSSSPFTIGDSSVFAGRFFNGTIDEVAVWNRALSAAEIAAIYQARSGGSVTPPCALTLGATGGSVIAAGGTGSIAVQATCAWTAASTVAWIRITSGAGGNGNGTVSFTVDANSGAPRTGTITVGDQTYTVNQGGTPEGTTPGCNYLIQAASQAQNLPAAGGNGLIQIVTAQNCSWTVSTRTPWITIRSLASGTGNGAVAYVVAPNDTAVARSGSIVVAGQAVTINQEAGVVPGTPVVANAGIVNAASYAPAGPPDGRIAQGSFFSIFGSDLGPDEFVKASSYPLPKSLGGVTIQIIQGTTTYDAYLIFASKGQLNAILPSNVPAGDARIVVGFNGKSSRPADIRVVKTSLGVFFQRIDGKDFAIAQNVASATDYPLNLPDSPAKPGQIVILWGTGLGPVTGADNTSPGASDMIDVPVTITVGGVAAERLYAGRQPESAGVDNVYFKVPAGISFGCRVPVAVSAGGTPANTTLIAITANGAPCTP